MKEKQQHSKLKHAETSNLDQRALARLELEKRASMARKEENKKTFQEEYVKQWERELGVQKARKDQ